MATLPELLDEDVQQIHSALGVFLDKSEATLALVAAEGGFLILQHGEVDRFDTTTLGALAANAYNAAQAIANTIEETNFKTIFQQGDRYCLLVCGIDAYNSLIVLFPAQISVGAVKYYAGPAVEAIGRQFARAADRPSARSLDFRTVQTQDPTVTRERSHTCSASNVVSPRRRA
jgi:predicted regulator of Ras-like GTPase activity (Roadblock/LC7/MglB family)